MEIWIIILKKSFETSLTFSELFQSGRIYFTHYVADACLVFNPIMVDRYAALFNCTAVVQVSDSMTASR